MIFSDFVESMVGAPICCELKQYLDKFYESYSKNPETHLNYPRGTANGFFRILLPLLSEMYKDGQGGEQI